jgi:hypothetical protein
MIFACFVSNARRNGSSTSSASGPSRTLPASAIVIAAASPVLGGSGNITEFPVTTYASVSLNVSSSIMTPEVSKLQTATKAQSQREFAASEIVAQRVQPRRVRASYHNTRQQDDAY